MIEQKEIPEGFNTWMQFYDYANKTIPLDPATEDLLDFSELTRHVPLREHYIKIEILKAKCFDEINSKRLSIEEMDELTHLDYSRISSSPNREKILGMLNVMTKSE